MEYGCCWPLLQLHRLVKISDRRRRVSHGLPYRAAVVIGFGVARAKLQSAIQVGERGLGVAQSVAGGAAIVVRLGVPGIDLDRPVEVGDGPGQVAQGVVGGSAIGVRLGIARRQLDRPVEVGDGPGQVAQALASDPPIVPGLSVSRIDFQDAVEVGDCAEVIAVDEATGSAKPLFSGLSHVDHCRCSSTVWPPNATHQGWSRRNMNAFLNLITVVWFDSRCRFTAGSLFHLQEVPSPFRRGGDTTSSGISCDSPESCCTGLALSRAAEPDRKWR